MTADDEAKVHALFERLRAQVDRINPKLRGRILARLERIEEDPRLTPPALGRIVSTLATDLVRISGQLLSPGSGRTAATPPDLQAPQPREDRDVDPD